METIYSFLFYLIRDDMFHYRILELVLLAPFLIYFLSLFNLDDPKSERRGFGGLMVLFAVVLVIEFKLFIPEEEAKFVSDINNQILSHKEIIELHPGAGNYEATKLLLENGYREVGYYNQIKYFGRK